MLKMTYGYRQRGPEPDGVDDNNSCLDSDDGSYRQSSLALTQAMNSMVGAQASHVLYIVLVVNDAQCGLRLHNDVAVCMRDLSPVSDV